MDRFFESSSSLVSTNTEKLDKATQVFTHDVVKQKLAKSEHPHRHVNKSRKLFNDTEKNKARPLKNINYQPQPVFPYHESHILSTLETENKIRIFLNNCKQLRNSSKN